MFVGESQKSIVYTPIESVNKVFNLESLVEKNIFPFLTGWNDQDFKLPEQSILSQVCRKFRKVNSQIELRDYQSLVKRTNGEWLALSQEMLNIKAIKFSLAFKSLSLTLVNNGSTSIKNLILSNRLKQNNEFPLLNLGGKVNAQGDSLLACSKGRYKVLDSNSLKFKYIFTLDFLLNFLKIKREDILQQTVFLCSEDRLVLIYKTKINVNSEMSDTQEIYTYPLFAAIFVFSSIIFELVSLKKIFTSDEEKYKIFCFRNCFGISLHSEHIQNNKYNLLKIEELISNEPINRSYEIVHKTNNEVLCASKLFNTTYFQSISTRNLNEMYSFKISETGFHVVDNTFYNLLLLKKFDKFNRALVFNKKLNKLIMKIEFVGQIKIFEGNLIVTFDKMTRKISLWKIRQCDSTHIKCDLEIPFNVANESIENVQVLKHEIILMAFNNMSKGWKVYQYPFDNNLPITCNEKHPRSEKNSVSCLIS